MLENAKHSGRTTEVKRIRCEYRELQQVAGDSVNFDTRLSDGDSISIYRSRWGVSNG